MTGQGGAGRVRAVWGGAGQLLYLHYCDLVPDKLGLLQLTDKLVLIPDQNVMDQGIYLKGNL